MLRLVNSIFGVSLLSFKLTSKSAVICYDGDVIYFDCLSPSKLVDIWFGVMLWLTLVIRYAPLKNGTFCKSKYINGCIFIQPIDSTLQVYDLVLNNLNKSTHTFSNLINQNDRSKVNEVSWLNYPGLNNTTYNQQGNYDESGNLKIMDSGPSNFDSLLKSFLS